MASSLGYKEVTSGDTNVGRYHRFGGKLEDHVGGLQMGEVRPGGLRKPSGLNLNTSGVDVKGVSAKAWLWKELKGLGIVEVLVTGCVLGTAANSCILPFLCLFLSLERRFWNQT